MSFVDNIAANPIGGAQGSSISGQPGIRQPQANQQDPLDLVNRIKDRQMQDFKDKANFMSDLSLKQDRLRNYFNPLDLRSQTGPHFGDIQQGDQGGGPNVVQGKDPNEMSGYEKGELGVRQQGVNLEQQKLAQSGKMGQEALDIKSQQEKLNQQKSDQINATKTADMQHKIETTNQQLQLAQEKLKQAGTNAAATIKAHEDLAKIVEQRHQLEMDMRQHQFDITSGQHQAAIDAANKKLQQSGRSKTTTTDSTGATRTTTTEKGSAADTIQVTGKDGQTYEIPADKEDEWNSTHAPDDSSDNSDSEQQQ